MSFNPCRANLEIRSRQERLAQSVGISVRGEILSLLRGSARDPCAEDGAALPKQQADALIARYAPNDVEEVMLLALQPARDYARPSISSVFVGADGLEKQTADLVLGNMEFREGVA